MSDLELVPSIYFISTFRKEKRWMERGEQYNQLSHWGQVLAHSTKTCGLIYSAREQRDSDNPHFHGIVCVPSFHREKIISKLCTKRLGKAWHKKTGARIIKLEPYKSGLGTVDYCWPKHEFSRECFCHHCRACVRHGCRCTQDDWLGVQQFLL